MRFDSPLIKGKLVRRYKRFLVDAVLESGEEITAHTPNTGAMTGCCTPGAPVWLSRSENPARKYPHTLELVGADNGELVGVHTLRSNQLAEEAIRSGMTGLPADAMIRREVSYGRQRSRVDLLLTEGTREIYVEVKNVTLASAGTGYFPDAPTTRGNKHLKELMSCVDEGKEAVIFFVVQRADVQHIEAARLIDPTYSHTLNEAIRHGVIALACRCIVTAGEIMPERMIPMHSCAVSK